MPYRLRLAGRQAAAGWCLRVSAGGGIAAVAAGRAVVPAVAEAVGRSNRSEQVK